MNFAKTHYLRKFRSNLSLIYRNKS